MKKISLKFLSKIIFITLFVAAYSVNSYAASPDNIYNPRDTGEIQFTVDYCGQGGRAGLHLYIPGMSMLTVTGSGNIATMFFVPVGIYNVVASENGEVLTMVSGIAVAKRQLTQAIISLCPDKDADGYSEVDDCNDLNPFINPGAIEECDGVDNNCDGQVDEGCPTCSDGDGDGFMAQSGCGTLVDCDDANPIIFPGAAEACFDAVDNNCNGVTDEGCPTCTAGTSCGDVPETGVGQCTTGLFDQECNCVGVVFATSETCDSLDNDCDGVIDNNCKECSDTDISLMNTCLSDCGGDPACSFNCAADNGISQICTDAVLALGQCVVLSGCSDLTDMACITGNCLSEYESVFGPVVPDCNNGDVRLCGGSNIGECQFGTETCVSGFWNGVCEGEVFPSGELCDGLDNDCDGTVDNACVADNDGDGYPEGWDCNDNDPNIFPGAEEVCNQVDDNCDGEIDEGLPTTNWYPDNDGDGTGSTWATPISACASPGPSYVENSLDCDDADPQVNPDAAESCNLIDDNCDGIVDEGCSCSPANWGEVIGCENTNSSGSCAGSEECTDIGWTSCTAPVPTEEICDYIDNNCDGQIDEGLPMTNWYVDNDGDGYGDNSAPDSDTYTPPIYACMAPDASYVENNVDCDDANHMVHPWIYEGGSFIHDLVCHDGLDNDCDGAIDLNDSQCLFLL